MDQIQNQTNKEGKDSLPNWGVVHFILSHSYTLFLLAVILGVVMDSLTSIALYQQVLFQYIGLFMLLTGPMLIYWAQYTSSCSKTKMEKEKTERDFEAGPYKYTRNPTHLGLAVMTLGLAFIINSFFSVIFIIIASVISKLIFLPKEEAVLEARYGQPYRDYKKRVNTWV
ncbi:MAG: isoprenylcysteine carboxylmethyltransferase family protein [bacterium]